MKRRIFLKLLGVTMTLPFVTLPEQTQAMAYSETVNRVNTSLAVIDLQKAVYKILESHLGNLNDDQTRKSITDAVSSYASLVRAKRVIRDFQVICDESNNTPENVDKNILLLDVFIQPSGESEYIEMNFRVG